MPTAWLTATNPTAATDVKVSFPTPAGTPNTGANLQKFRAVLRKTAGEGHPTIDMELWETGGGSALATLLDNVPIRDPYTQIVEGTWDAALLGTASGAAVQCRIVSTPAEAPGALPAYSSAGTLFDDATMPGTRDINVPAHTSGDLLLLLVLCRNTDNNGTLSAINTGGWTQAGGAGTMYGGAQNARIGFGWKIGDGSETVVNITTTGGTGTDRIKARVYRFTAANGFAATPVQFIGTATSGTGTTATAPTVTPSFQKCRAVALFGMSVSTTVAPPTTEIGGDWTEPVAEDAGTNGTIGILTSDQSTGATISGGTFTITSSAWVGVGLALVPANVAGGPVNTVEIGAIEWFVDHEAANIIGLASSAEQALAVTAARAVAVGLPESAEQAFAVAAVRTVAVGLPASAEEALVTTGAKAVAVGVAQSAEAAPAVAAVRVVATGLAQSAEEAPAVTAVKAVAMGLAESAEQALPVTISIAAGVAESAEQATAVTATKVVAVGLAEGGVEFENIPAEQAYSVIADKLLPAGQTSDFGAALVGEAAQTNVVTAHSFEEALAVKTARAVVPGLAVEVSTAEVAYPGLPGHEIPLLQTLPTWAGAPFGTTAFAAGTISTIGILGLADSVEEAPPLLAGRKTLAVGTVTEHGDALGVTPPGIAAIHVVRANELDAAQAVGKAKRAAVGGFAAETSEARPASRESVIPLGFAASTEQVPGVSRDLTVIVGTANIAGQWRDIFIWADQDGWQDQGEDLNPEQALSITTLKEVDLGVAEESAAAIEVGRSKSAALGLASETDAATETRPSTDIPAGLAEESASTFALTSLKTAAVGLVTAEELARPVHLPDKKVEPVDRADEFDETFGIRGLHVAHLGFATEAEAAQPAQYYRTVHLGIAEETDTAQEMIAVGIFQVDVAVETDSALAIIPARGRSVDPAISVETALVINRHKLAELGVALESDTARPAMAFGLNPVLLPPFAARGASGVTVARGSSGATIATAPITLAEAA